MGNLAHLCTKTLFHNNSRGLKPEHGAELPGPLTLIIVLQSPELLSPTLHASSTILGQFHEEQTKYNIKYYNIEYYFIQFVSRLFRL